MKALLRSDVELWQITAFAEVAEWERRPELQRVCAAVPKRGGLGPAEIDKVLPGLSEAARKNIVRHLKYLRLLDERGALTALGRRCASSGEAPAWEMGVYEFLVAVHPAFRSHVLAFQRLQADARDRDFQNLEPIPEWFGPAPGRVWASALDSGRRFTVQSFPTSEGIDPRCRTQKLQPAQLVWEIDLASGENAWHIEGNDGGSRGRVSFRSQPESMPEAKLVDLLGTWDKRWNRTSSRLEMPYDGKASDGHDTFLRTFHYRRVKVADFGTFDDVVVDGVPVGPRNSTEAREWALELTVARIAAADAYCSKESWAKEWDMVVRGSPLEAGAGRAPGADAVTSFGGEPLPIRTRWLLVAASDLAME